MSALVPDPKETLEPISTYSSDYYRISERIKQDLPDITINRIEKVHNPFLKAAYELKRAEYEVRYGAGAVKEIELFHSTREDVAGPISRDNFNWRLIFRCKYGLGTSFTPDADYANCHSNRRNGRRRVFIVTRVLVAKETYGRHYLEIPPEDYDTATSYNGLVYVKFHDNEFLPLFVVYYYDPGYTASKYYRNRNYC